MATKPKAKAKRAHEKDGQFSADDPSTPEKNEAFVDSKPPAEKKSRRKVVVDAPARRR